MANLKTTDPFGVEADKPASVPAATPAIPQAELPASPPPAVKPAIEQAGKPAGGQVDRPAGEKAAKRVSQPATKRAGTQARKRSLSGDRGPTLYVRLSAGEHDWLRDLAHVERVPVAAVVRALIDLAMNDPDLAAQAVEGAVVSEDGE